MHIFTLVVNYRSKPEDIPQRYDYGDGVDGFTLCEVNCIFKEKPLKFILFVEVVKFELSLLKNILTSALSSCLVTMVSGFTMERTLDSQA